MPWVILLTRSFESAPIAERMVQVGETTLNARVSMITPQAQISAALTGRFVDRPGVVPTALPHYLSPRFGNASWHSSCLCADSWRSTVRNRGSLLAGVGLGSALTYYLDPDRGARPRS